MTFANRYHEDGLMPDTVQCDAHGETPQAFVCVHLKGDATALGFNREEPSEDNPNPDAWCDECEKLRKTYEGWDDVPEEQCKISLLCAHCYERARIRNTHTAVTLDDMAGLHWKCGKCDEWHSGPMLDVAFDEPHYWTEEHARANELNDPASQDLRKPGGTFLDDDFCAIDDEHFFIRGTIRLPIVGSGEYFCWGVWGSLKRENYERVWGMRDDPNRTALEPMFSWLSSRISYYPDTLNLKMYAHVQEPRTRPYFELEESDHPLSKEFHHGITPERVREIMLREIRAEQA